MLNVETGRLPEHIGRLLIGCVAENTPKYLAQALRLVQSWRWFGGSLSQSDIIVCVIDELDDFYAIEFRKMGCLTRIVPRFSALHGPSNKLRFLELPEVYSYDTIMLMDCDTIVTGDPSGYFNGNTLQAKIADVATVPHQLFERVFKHYGFVLPERKYSCTFSGEKTIFYCNAGVIIFPVETLRKFYPVWRRYTVSMNNNLDLLEDRRFFCEQASFSLAYAESHVEFEELPVAMNFPLHLDGEPLLQSMLECDPVIIHYHSMVDPSGFIFINHSGYPLAQKRIDEFNKLLRETRRKAFNNRTFWDVRYANHPELGSGIGSRGVYLRYKRQIIEMIVQAIKPGTILDIGCGDQFTTENLPDEGYTGLDVSPIIIEQNKNKFPLRNFIAGDLLDNSLKLSSTEFSLCFDVVIHLGDSQYYEKFIMRLLELTERAGIISGFEIEPDVKSEITFFHEPLSQTLRNYGIENLIMLGQYRDTCIWYFEKVRETGDSYKPEVCTLQDLVLPIDYDDVQRAGYFDELIVSGETLVARGWARNPYTLEPPAAIILTNERSRWLKFVIVDVLRNDVENNFQDTKMLMSGWETKIRIRSLPGTKNIIKAYAYLSDSSRKAILLENSFEVEGFQE